MEEIWKDVVGYEGLYQVSNLGNVKGKKVKSQHISNRGYLTVLLYKDGVGLRKTVHRIVATAFLDNPLNLSDINHIDENRLNNAVDNLEWCDHRYNVKCYRENHRDENTRNGKRKSLRIMQLSLDGELIKVWDNSRTIFLETGMSDWSISQCCRELQKTAYGYKWQYANTDNSDRETAI